MAVPNLSVNHLAILVMLFCGGWLYSEYREERVRRAFYNEVDGFMHKGDRFTQDEGDELEMRLRTLEARYNAHLEHSARFTEKIVHNERDFTDLRNRVIRLEDERNHDDSSR